MSDKKLEDIVEKIGNDGLEYLKECFLNSINSQNFREFSSENSENFSQISAQNSDENGSSSQAKNSQNSNFSTFFNALTGGNGQNAFLKGALVGASVAYLLINENAQKTLFSAIAKGSALFSAGIEELKEMYEDARAEASENA